MNPERIIAILANRSTKLRQAVAALASAIEHPTAIPFADPDSYLISDADSGVYLHDNRSREFATHQLKTSWFVVNKTPIRERQINLHQHQRPQLRRRIGFPRSGYLPRRIRRIRKSR